MSEMSRDARRALRAKAHRLANQTVGKVDASDYGPEENMHANAKTGMKPISRAAYKSGGKVEGEDAKHNAGRKPRASGGKAIADDIANTDQKEANQQRDGYKFDGGLKRGGRAKRSVGGTIAAAGLGGLGGLGLSELLKRKERACGGAASSAARDGMRPVGGREARKKGGKVNVNIVIATGKPDEQQGPPMGASPIRPPMAPPPAAPPPGPPMGLAGAGSPPPLGPPPGMPPPMPRKRGGRTALHGGAGGGTGRLDKIGIHKYDP